MSENLRRFPRKEIEIEIELRFLEDNAHIAVTQNMSEGGVLMRVDDAERYPIGEMVSLRFKNPFDDFADVEKDGIIVRHTDDGFSVSFV
jgi:hypothetical protein